jgi:hypothetical protein
MNNEKILRASVSDSDSSLREPSFSLEGRLRPSRTQEGSENSGWEWVEDREMGERLVCDICNREEGLFEIRKLAPFVTCERLVCGHWWHLALSNARDGDKARHQECDCPDYIRPNLVA